MPFKIVCSCGVALLAGDDLSNLKVACPECGSYTSLPDVPDPYKLPTNAEMIPLEIEEVEQEQGSKSRVKSATVRRKGGEGRNRGAPYRPQGPKEMTTTEVVLIVSLAAVGMIIVILLFAYM